MTPLLTLSELKWIAGFIEGEGSFFYSKKSTARVTAVQKQRWPLEELRRLIGGTLYFTGRNYWQWHVGGEVAAGLMMTLFQLMSPRRKEQIKTALTFWKESPPWNKNKTACPRGHPYSILGTQKGGSRMRGCKQCNAKRMRDKRANS